MSLRSTLRERTRTCPTCRRTFLVDKPSRKTRYCGHKCVWKVIGAKVRAASQKPAARRRLANALRHRGRGVSYIKRGGRHEHLGIAERKLGRRLRKGEIVYHRDRDHRNNRPSNIAVARNRAVFARWLFTGMPRPKKTHCKNGHAFTDKNTLINSQGRRLCLTCSRAYDREWKRNRWMELAA